MSSTSNPSIIVVQNFHKNTDTLKKCSTNLTYLALCEMQLYEKRLKCTIFQKMKSYVLLFTFGNMGVQFNDEFKKGYSPRGIKIRPGRFELSFLLMVKKYKLLTQISGIFPLLGAQKFPWKMSEFNIVQFRTISICRDPIYYFQ